ncbi:hypothetical protein [Heyndrickxia camelliae]|uniref:Uncharacterized protein n=1 Tax=Heyndrickxia camelliae TaxID=1707093 RepID=A0A2N3LE58_9BACI|nr:hypothetical protein [Heyndrickxia camelliae]PKR82898.1 hypothetical protein CWO92_22165 [Heyndrickxia camelliae]
MNRFDGNDNYGKPKMEYVNKINNMSDEELFEETKSKIWLSAYANNNPRSDYHWHVDACYEVWNVRNEGEGYKKAFNEVMKGILK